MRSVSKVLLHANFHLPGSLASGDDVEHGYGHIELEKVDCILDLLLQGAQMTTAAFCDVMYQSKTISSSALTFVRHQLLQFDFHVPCACQSSAYHCALQLSRDERLREGERLQVVLSSQ